MIVMVDDSYNPDWVDFEVLPTSSMRYESLGIYRFVNPRYCDLKSQWTYGNFKAVCEVQLSRKLDSYGKLRYQLRSHRRDARYLRTVSVDRISLFGLQVTYLKRRDRNGRQWRCEILDIGRR